MIIGVFIQKAVHVTLLLQIFVNPYGNSIQTQHKYKHQYWQQETVLPITQLKAVLNSLNFGALNNTLSPPPQSPHLHTHTHTHTHTQRDEETTFLHFCMLCYSD
jgi:hypothetical protein